MLCFRRIAHCFHSGPEGIWGLRNLVSIGDRLEEHEATMTVAQCCPCYVKFVKLVEQPTMSQLAEQLDVCSKMLCQMASHAGNLHVDLGHAVVGQGQGVHSEFLTSVQHGLSEPMKKKRRLLSWAGRLGA